MKLTELILQLHTIMLEKGNLEVWLDTEDGPVIPDVTYHPSIRCVYLN